MVLVMSLAVAADVIDQMIIASAVTEPMRQEAWLFATGQGGGPTTSVDLLNLPQTQEIIGLCDETTQLLATLHHCLFAEASSVPPQLIVEVLIFNTAPSGFVAA